MKRLIAGLALLMITIMSAQMITAQAQSLDIQARSVNNGKVLPNNGVRIPFLQIILRTEADPVTVKNVTLSRSGLSSSEDVGRVWLASEFSPRLTRARQFNNDDLLTLELNRGGYTIEPFTTEIWTVLANLEFDGSGRTLAINLEDVAAETGASNFFGNNTNQRRTQVTNRSFNRNFQLNSEITDVKPISQTPTTTKRRFTYDKSKYRVKCRNSRCQLVLR